MLTGSSQTTVFNPSILSNNFSRTTSWIMKPNDFDILFLWHSFVYNLSIYLLSGDKTQNSQWSMLTQSIYIYPNLSRTCRDIIIEWSSSIKAIQSTAMKHKGLYPANRTCLIIWKWPKTFPVNMMSIWYNSIIKVLDITIYIAFHSW